MDTAFLESHDVDVPALIVSARWFSNLSHAIASTGVIVVNPDQWQAVVRVANAGGFGESPDPADQAAIPDFEWLDDELEQTEQALQEAAISMQEAAISIGLGDACKTARMEAIRLSLTSLRQLSEHPLFTVGPTNTEGGARQMALVACRVAMIEQILGRAGLGCRLLQLLHQGQWPFGRTMTGELLVL